MSVPTAEPVLRPGATGLKKVLMRWAMALMPTGFALLRAVRPISRWGNTYLITRHDDVREVFATDAAFGVPYKPKLDVIMGGQPFFLGMGNTDQYRADTAAMRRVVKASEPVACSPPLAWIASRALTARLTITCSSCRGSARTGPSSRS